MSLTEAVKEWFLKEVLHNQKEIKHAMSQLSDTLAAIGAKQDAQDAGFVSFKTDLDKALADLAAKIAAGGVQQADLDALNALGARIDANTGKLTDLDTEVKNADQ